MHVTAIWDWNNGTLKVKAIKLQKNQLLMQKVIFETFPNVTKIYAKVTNSVNLHKASVKSEEAWLSDSDK